MDGACILHIACINVAVMMDRLHKAEDDEH